MTNGKSTSIVVRNIYYMMAYAFRSLDLKEYSRLETEDFDGIEDLFAAILAIGIDLQLKRGLERGYSSLSDNLPGIKGRINVRKTARLQATSMHLVACEWDELTEDTYKNRILKTVARLLSTSELVSIVRRRRLKKSLLGLRDVGTLDPNHIDWQRLRYHKNNASYQLLMNTCYMALNSMIMTENEGLTKLAEFSDSRQLHTLYERFVLEYFKRHHPHLKPTAKTIPRSIEGDTPSFLPRLLTDVTLQRQERTLIIDCKCYGQILKTHHGKEIASAANLNQILSYVLHEAYGDDRAVSGMLLYAMTEDGSEFTTSWNDLGHDFYLWTLNLGDVFSNIAARLDEIATLV